ncbi:hypothetical protein AJ80_02403 [Polytolypa hystricis UAMH7299]|uniref:Nephrocystin 3-like N-terminal domain-containing protein n=1 Tax=Polytolypa hystricis (strain UAMH7299) TaxID=1447883 RepID=A0A2B7YRX9_POLH7|nr:hypothetical protein AJ80_02403 [Polytolypa hystricis UAMH7299]
MTTFLQLKSKFGVQQQKANANLIAQLVSNTVGANKNTTALLAAKTFPAGIKELHVPDNAIVDVVFVHGLTGNRKKTWTAAGSDLPWPQTLLPPTVPGARILTFGYDGYVTDWRGMVSNNHLGNHSKNLLNALTIYRDDTDTRPIIFVAHGLGGLVCKDALLFSDSSPEIHHRHFVESTVAIIFIGTPHAGSDLAVWAARLARWFGSKNRVPFNAAGSIHKPIQITCFYEELPLVGIGEVVPKHSAIVPGYISIGIHKNHLEMTKFDDPNDPGFVNISRELRRWVRGLKPTLAEIDLETSQMLQALFVLDPVSSLREIEYEKDKLLEGTGSWIYRCPKSLDQEDSSCRNAAASYLQWHDDPSVGILSMYGYPGTGKTMLAISLIRELEKRTNNGKMVAYFFFANTDHQTNTANSAVRCLLWQIFTKHPNLLVHLRTKYKTQSKDFLLADSELALATLWVVLENVICDTTFPCAYFIIDGLDECKSDLLDTFLTYLSDLVKSGEFRLSYKTALCLYLEEHAQYLTREVNRYITQKVNYLQQIKSYDPALREKVGKYLHEHAEGSFLWASATCKELERPSTFSFNTETTLMKLPQGLKLLYERMLQQVLGNESPELLGYAINLLKAVVVAFGPLTIEQIAVAAGLPLEIQRDHQHIRDCISMSGSFLRIREETETVFVIHQSARGFISSTLFRTLKPYEKARTGVNPYCTRPNFCHDGSKYLASLESPTLSSIYSPRRFPIDTVHTRKSLPAPFLHHHPLNVSLDLSPDSLTPESSFLDFSTQFWIAHAQRILASPRTLIHNYPPVADSIVPNSDEGRLPLQCCFKTGGGYVASCMPHHCHEIKSPQPTGSDANWLNQVSCNQTLRWRNIVGDSETGCPVTTSVLSINES